MTHSKTQSGRNRWLAPLVSAVGGGAAYALAIRPWHLRWGATAEEAITPLAGDDLVPDAAYVTTRAATIQVPPGAVWPWLVQMGQGRAGFYTYDRLEQMIGAAISSADLIVPELQQLAVGDTIPLSPVGGPKVAFLDPGGALVLFETMDLRTGQSIPSLPPTRWAMDWTWSFTLRPTPAGATQLLVRTRAAYRPRALLGLALPVLLEPAHFVMERGMLLGIKRRAETGSIVPTTAAAGTVGTTAAL
jgi:hypothetical protein